MKLIGVDIGGSHIAAAALNFSDGQVSLNDFQESEIDTYQTATKIITDWAELIKAVANGEQTYQVGIAMPGPFDYENGISLIQDQGKMKSLFKLNVKNLLAESLSISPDSIRFTNDAEAFLLGESSVGSGSNFENSIGLTLGTGLGSAIKVGDVVKDAKLWTAPFRSGIAEDYLGTAWFVKESKTRFNLDISGVKELIDLEEYSEQANLIFETFGKTLAEFLFPYLIRLQTDVVILGGKISLLNDRFLPAATRYLINKGYPVQFKHAALGDNAALIGACQSFISNN